MNRAIGVISLIGATLLTIITVLAFFALVLISISASAIFFLEGTDLLIKGFALPKNPLGFFVAMLLLSSGICLCWTLYKIMAPHWAWRIPFDGCVQLIKILLMIMGLIGMFLLLTSSISFFEYVHSGWLETVIVVMIWLVFGAFFMSILSRRERRR